MNNTNTPRDNLYVESALVPLVEKLRARYPGVQVVSARFMETHRGVLQQTIRFAGPIERLRAYGLVADRMITSFRKRGGEHTPIGDGYSLFDRPLDGLVAPGNWDLTLHTGTEPRERERISVKDAARVLRAFTLRNRKGRPKREKVVQ